MVARNHEADQSQSDSNGVRAEETPVRVEIDSRIAVVTIDRPEVHNAMNTPVMMRLRAELDRLEQDETVDLVVVTGAGEKSFVAGADINELARRNPIDGLGATMQALYERVEQFPKPTIAAVNGYAFGGGNELAMACDIRVASTNARFALPETGLGIIPAAGATQRLARIVGIGRATDMILTGRRIKASEALDWGLVTEVAEPAVLMETVREIAGRVLSKGPLAIRLARTVIRRGFDVDHETGMLLERLAQSVIYSTDEKTEGTTAFLEGRTPDYSGVHHARTKGPGAEDA